MTARVYQADAGDALRRLPRGSVSLVLTDPPHKSLTRGKLVYQGGVGYRQLPWSTIARHLALTRPRLRRGGLVMVIVNRAGLADARAAMRGAGFTQLRTIAWTSGPALGGDPSKFRRGRVLLGTRRDYVVVGGLPGARIDDQRLVQSMPVSPATKGHYPTEKPEYLGAALARIAKVGRGDLVVDPYCGSGALLVGAQRRGAAVIGIDRSPTAVRVARRRLGLPRSAIVRRAVMPGRDKPAGRGT